MFKKWHYEMIAAAMYEHKLRLAPEREAEYTDMIAHLGGVLKRNSPKLDKGWFIDLCYGNERVENE